MGRKLWKGLFYASSAAALLIGGASLAGMMLNGVAGVDDGLMIGSLAALAAAIVLTAARRPREAAVLAILSAAAGYAAGLHMVSAGLTWPAFFRHHAVALLPVPFAAAAWALAARRRVREKEDGKVEGSLLAENPRFKKTDGGLPAKPSRLK